MGIHSASDCLQGTAFYNQTVGAMFDYHPPIQDAVSIQFNPYSSTKLMSDIHASDERSSRNSELPS